jgi:choline dehydrogenase
VFIQQVIAQRALDEYRGAELTPGSTCQSDQDIDAFLREKSETCYHPVSTCRMGSPENDEMVVVDANCRAAGVEGLRVVDASIMPSIVSGNTNAPTIMMAEKASDIILGRPPLPKSNVPDWRKVVNDIRQPTAV